MENKTKCPSEKKIRRNGVCAYAACVFLLSAFCLFPASADGNSVFKSAEASQTSAAGARTAAAGLAEQEFRRGVQAYYRGSFNDAVLEFEKALSYLPSENLILDWLGKSYYRSGIEGAALEQWQFASDAGYGGLLLQNRIEIVRERRITDNLYDSAQRYTEAGSFPGKKGDKLFFSQPVAALPNSDGTVWILSYGSNELLKIDVNGLILTRSNGPLNGFDRPMDIIRLSNGNMLISEFAGDRLSLFDPSGKHIKTFGTKGRGVGNMVGPEYEAQDKDGSIFVTDFGNARVDVFDGDGNPLFFFGTKNDEFAGLKAPTGIAVIDETVFVADALTGAVYRFDRSGNYLGLLCREKTFIRPESMKVWGQYIIICDKNRIVSIDSETGAVYENARTGNAPSRVTSAVPDVNGNLLVTDVKSDEVYVMTKTSELVGGLFVQIERVISDSFPKVTVELKVENRRRQGVVGLKDINFFVTEEKRPVADFKLDGAASYNDTADITLLIDRSPESAGYPEALETAVREIAASMKGKGTLRVVCAGSVPVTEYTGTPDGVRNFTIGALKTPVSSDCALDLGIRLAANTLINAEKKRAVIFITAGTVAQNAFTKYGLSDLTAYLNNNAIAFATVQLQQGSFGKEISYICDNTNGDEYYVYRSEGLSGVVTDLIALPAGMYRISYTSSLPTDFGRAYLPVEVEAYLMNRSGRDETGYFAPLQ
jgi:DNA-binding beta-propeller fold protein YncE